MRRRRTVLGRRATSASLVAFLTVAIVGIPAFAGAVKPDDPGAQGPGQEQGEGHGGPHASPTPTLTTIPAPLVTPTSDPEATAEPAMPPAPEAAAAAHDRDPGADTETSDAAAAPSGSTHPPGNNGTVKIDGQEWDDAPDNEPHVGCTFQLDLYGYDEGADLSAAYRFELWAPTGNGGLGRRNRADRRGPGRRRDGPDASVTIDIEDEVLSSGFDPHPMQGWHVRLTVHADGSIGADVKHKMLWVTCGPEQATGSPPPPAVGPTTVTPTTTTGPPAVAPETVRPPTVPPENLPFTGSPLGALVAAEAVLLVIGTAALRLSARASG